MQLSPLLASVILIMYFAAYQLLSSSLIFFRLFHHTLFNEISKFKIVIFIYLKLLTFK